MTVKAGNLRDRVTFQRAVTADDGYGNTVARWEDYLTVWADILETPGREGLAAGRVEGTRTATMRVRRCTETRAITEADRVRARGRVWNIRSPGDVGRDRVMLEMVIEAGVAA